MSLSQSNEVPAPVAHDVTGEQHPQGAHAVPKRILLAVYAALLVFTVITVGVAQLDLGIFNIWVALLVAVIKGALVALFFMHLFWDSPFNGLILVAALFFVALFIGIAMLDAHSYQVNNLPPEELQASMTTGNAAPAVVDSTPKISTLSRSELLDAIANQHGDPDLGEQIFTKQGCVACHTLNPNDPPKGPCLADIGKKYNRRDLAENIIDPNMKIAEGFETHHYKLNDEIQTASGSTGVVEGFLVSATPDKITIRQPSGVIITFSPSNVDKSKVLKTSPMPEGIVGWWPDGAANHPTAPSLTVREFASLLDFLQSLSSGG